MYGRVGMMSQPVPGAAGNAIIRALLKMLNEEGCDPFLNAALPGVFKNVVVTGTRDDEHFDGCTRLGRGSFEPARVFDGDDVVGLTVDNQDWPPLQTRHGINRVQAGGDEKRAEYRRVVAGDSPPR